MPDLPPDVSFTDWASCQTTSLTRDDETRRIDSSVHDRYLVLSLQLCELFLKHSNLFLEHFRLPVFRFWLRYLSCPALFSVLSRWI